jgi:tetratricopeptide (TPR) repeat protein
LAYFWKGGLFAVSGLSYPAKLDDRCIHRDSFAMVGFNIPWVLSGLLLIPYLVWGIYLLRQRLVYHLELDRAVETFTVAFLVCFLVFELALIRIWLQDSPFQFALATLGLVASAFALYGPLLMSFGSHLIVDVVMPSSRPDRSIPLYGAAEACESRGDFEAAIREYIAIARMFPAEVTAAARAADNLMKVDRPEEAIVWFEKALFLSRSPDESLRLTNRLFDVYLRRLDNRIEAHRTLVRYLERFPDAEYAESVRDRLRDLDIPKRQTSSEIRHL